MGIFPFNIYYLWFGKISCKLPSLLWGRFKAGAKMKEKKIKAAAMAGIAAYIKTEEEAAQALAQASPGIEAQKIFDDSISRAKPWGISGRQAQMNARFLMQMKAFH